MNEQLAALASWVSQPATDGNPFPQPAKRSGKGAGPVGTVDYRVMRSLRVGVERTGIRDHGYPVADLVSCAQASKTAVAEALARLEGQGYVAQAEGRWGTEWRLTAHGLEVAPDRMPN
jgi:hypothetical protein